MFFFINLNNTECMKILYLHYNKNNRYIKYLIDVDVHNKFAAKSIDFSTKKKGLF